jgi:hypothetical protein
MFEDTVVHDEEETEVEQRLAWDALQYFDEYI